MMANEASAASQGLSTALHSWFDEESAVYGTAQKKDCDREKERLRLDFKALLGEHEALQQQYNALLSSEVAKNKKDVVVAALQKEIQKMKQREQMEKYRTEAQLSTLVRLKHVVEREFLSLMEEHMALKRSHEALLPLARLHQDQQTSTDPVGPSSAVSDRGHPPVIRPTKPALAKAARPSSATAASKPPKAATGPSSSSESLSLSGMRAQGWLSGSPNVSHTAPVSDSADWKFDTALLRDTQREGSPQLTIPKQNAMKLEVPASPPPPSSAAGVVQTGCAEDWTVSRTSGRKRK
uniref:Uncharacterized protein n=1 Tax=Chromera velia CCMP2878 TaxID=1169474 RepID=A0A0G4I3C5_9ALVE|eukprot:Cvel_35336.t1-p1 / transcript=Cvel_35336.t1 / gene=Cvel_35336 / organism=Chromera_velia_CCMP2878 / gene_product=hypothetical protein / transcript_product=hypothetical protein / location=Cvel_scaffold6418:1742-2623(+) / protein_length=294 / sequence_SO=supercontig / SO=protein_coding / is_pseudo=false